MSITIVLGFKSGKPIGNAYDVVDGEGNSGATAKPTGNVSNSSADLTRPKSRAASRQASAKRQPIPVRISATHEWFDIGLD